MKTDEKKWTFSDKMFLVGAITAVLVLMHLALIFGDPGTSLGFYRFQDNHKYAAHINTKPSYLYALDNPKKLSDTNESTKILIDNQDKCTNIKVKYSTTTEPIWTELGDFVNMGDNQYLVDCVKTYPDTTITYCVSATNKKGEVEEFYFSYVIR